MRPGEKEFNIARGLSDVNVVVNAREALALGHFFYVLGHTGMYESEEQNLAAKKFYDVAKEQSIKMFPDATKNTRMSIEEQLEHAASYPDSTIKITAVEAVMLGGLLTSLGSLPYELNEWVGKGVAKVVEAGLKVTTAVELLKQVPNSTQNPASA